MCLFYLLCLTQTKHHTENQRSDQTNGSRDGAETRTANRTVALGVSLGIFRVPGNGTVMVTGDKLEKTGKNGKSCKRSKGRAEEKLHHNLTGSS